MRLLQHEDGFLVASSFRQGLLLETIAGSTRRWRHRLCHKVSQSQVITHSVVLEPDLYCVHACSCYKRKNKRFQPYAGKVSNSGLVGAADLVLEGAKKMKWLRGVPGVMQGEGAGFGNGEQAYAVMRQGFFVAGCTGQF